ncbi:unnamed protein product [Mytilus coruscus]|uniref:Uncharacterized protein n=1 Tax=Mytilus coruscus TaxID=42192 RepID=A0A6J8CCM3_MYTCO|nr:unnamed protein product [Mytilus coruscus]
MPTECVQDGGRCGALYSVWMNGTFPDEEEVANVTACTASYTGDCCSHPMDIQIKNCSSFLVYNLAAVTTCPKRYCFGSEMPCPKGETSLNGFSPGCKYEPCLPANYKNIDQWERSVGNKNGGQICDNVLEPGWYRPVSKAGREMPTSCPENGLKCGTTYPIWMNGTEIPCPLGETSNNNFTPGCEFDPCQSINYDTLKDEVKRSSNYTLLAGDEPTDDSRLKSGWYRVDSSTGNDIVTESVKMYQCGTIYPLWMNGTLPDEHDKTVDRKVCRSGPNGNICVEDYNMKVRNCGKYWKCTPIEKSKISSTVHTSPPTYDEAMQNGKKKSEAIKTH